MHNHQDNHQDKILEFCKEPKIYKKIKFWTIKNLHQFKNRFNQYDWYSHEYIDKMI